MNWAGGDPLLNTFIHYPEGELARLIFHELAHQVLYATDDTMFNESFATAVERLGVRALAAGARPAQARPTTSVRRPPPRSSARCPARPASSWKPSTTTRRRSARSELRAPQGPGDGRLPGELRGA